jgi:hypothetical protein
LKQEFASRYNAPLHGIGLEINSPLNRAIRAAGALHRHRHAMPPTRIAELEARVADHLGHIPNQAEVEDLSAMDEDPHGPNYRTHAEIIIDSVDLQEFIFAWRRHFLETMKPQFMPEKWDVNRPIQWDRESKRVLFNRSCPSSGPSTQATYPLP